MLINVFSCEKGDFDRFFNRLDRPVEESRHDRQPDRPVNPTGAVSTQLVSISDQNPTRKARPDLQLW